MFNPASEGRQPGMAWELGEISSVTWPKPEIRLCGRFVPQNRRSVEAALSHATKSR